MLASILFIIRTYLHICVFANVLQSELPLTSFEDVYEIFRCLDYEAANMSVKAGRPGQDQRFRRGKVAY
jgi:hypothetical protein